MTALDAAGARPAAPPRVDARAYRLSDIDMVRGLAIALMAIDHARDYLLAGTVQDPAANPNVSAAIFFTRWITHFCAPVFVFLAGTSAGLMVARRSSAWLGGFLLKRGLWLIVVEVVVIVRHPLVTFGRAPFAFYVAHIYLIHALAVAVGVLQGFQARQMATMVAFLPAGYGLPLPLVYVGWAAILIALYPLCRWVAAVKARRRDWWLSYV